MERGDVYWVNLDPTEGSEIKKTRPCVLVGASAINRARHCVVIIPLSSAAKSNPPITIPVNFNGIKGVAVCDQIRTVDKKRLAGRIGSLSSKELQSVGDGLKKVLSLA